MWDRQAGAHFGRPPLVRLRDCDVSEPAVVDDEFITRDTMGPQPADIPSRMGAFIFVYGFSWSSSPCWTPPLPRTSAIHLRS